MSDVGNLETPKEMPASIQQRIKNLTCPPPILPSRTSGRLDAVKKKIAEQTKKIASLEEQVSNLESRINISFQQILK